MSKMNKVIIVISSLILCLVLLGNFLPRLFSKEETYPYLSILAEVLHLVDRNYVEKVDIDKLANNGYIEMVNEIGGESSFLDKEDLDKINHMGNIGEAAIGIIIGLRDNYFPIIAVLPDSPAEKAGIKSGEYIYSIDNYNFMKLSLFKARMLLKGKPFTKVKVKTMFQISKKPKEYIIERENYVPKAYESKSLSEDIGYLHLYALDERNFEGLANELKKQDKVDKLLILDLRRCASDNYPFWIKAADLFLDKGTIMILKKRNKQLAKEEAKPGDTIFHKDMYVIIDKSTARGCEVLASAIIDNKRGLSIGAQTFGSASEKKFFQLSDEIGLILDIAFYYQPSEKIIQKEGIEPQEKYEGAGYDKYRGVIDTDEIIEHIVNLSKSKILNSKLKAS